MTGTYAFRDGIGGDIVRMSAFGIPTPAHAQTRAAELAREAVRRNGYDRRLAAEIAELVTEHGNPHVEPYAVPEYRTTKKGTKKPTGVTIAGPMPDAAKRLASLAERHGFRVNVFETAGNVRTVVEGFRHPYAFRAVWHRGRAESGTWHEARYRYALVEDTRPVGVSKLTRVALAKHRAAGVDSTHLAIIASPAGVSIGVAALSKRVSES